MKMRMLWMAALATVFCLSLAMPAKADDKNSNVGLKLNLGLGSKDVPAEQKLERGEAASLSLGYGVSQHVTLWLGAEVSGHKHEMIDSLENSIVGVELGVQYKFRPHQKFRPYGKLGFGTYFLGAEGVNALNGGGVNWAVGAEYRLWRFLSVGAELFWKDYDYTQQAVDNELKDFKNLEEPIPGNTRGLMINFTLH